MYLGAGRGKVPAVRSPPPNFQQGFLLNEHVHKADLIIFSRRLVEVKRLRHVWGYDIVIVPLGWEDQRYYVM
jgi:hypothetical protein